MSFWFDWYTKFHIVDPNSLTWQSTNMEAAFANGKIGELIVQKATDVPLYTAGAVGNNFAFAPTPSIPYGMQSLPPGGTAPGTFLSADGVGITQYASMPLALQVPQALPQHENAGNAVQAHRFAARHDCGRQGR